jgi:Effector Associated Constant Component 1
MLVGSIEIRDVGAGEDVRALRAWLSGEEDLRGRVRLVEPPTKTGQMGGITDAVTIAISGGGVATVTVRSVFAWLRQRQRGHRVRLTLQDSSGRRADVELDGLHDSESVLEKVLDFFSDDS